ncbi:MAG: hypothetical protein LC733_06135 [Actinobacteria bacterium]|nr:hypothetical protein [Actinomycetota bacterium]
MITACNNYARPEKPGPLLAGPADAAAAVRLSMPPGEEHGVVLLLCGPDHRLLLAVAVDRAPITGVGRAVDLVLQVADPGGITGLVIGIVRPHGGPLSGAEERSLAGLVARCGAAGVDLLDVLVVGRRRWRSLWHLAEAPAEGEDGDQ